MSFISEQFVRLLRRTADKIEAGNCELNEEQAIEIMKLIAHQPMSKEQSALYLNMSTSKFDSLVKLNILPNVRKRMGFKEKVWYQDELDEYVLHAKGEQSDK